MIRVVRQTIMVDKGKMLLVKNVVIEGENFLVIGVDPRRCRRLIGLSVRVWVAYCSLAIWVEVKISGSVEGYRALDSPNIHAEEQRPDLASGQAELRSQI